MALSRCLCPLPQTETIYKYQMPYFVTVDCKTAGGFFFLKIAFPKRWHGVRVQNSPRARQMLFSLTFRFQSRPRPFVWLFTRTSLRKKTSRKNLFSLLIFQCRTVWQVCQLKKLLRVSKKYIDCLFKTALTVFVHPAKTLILVIIFLLPWEEFN